MKNRSLPVFFTFLYLLAMVKPVWPVIDYVVNQDYIAAYFCINKDKPKLHCNGKCYLAQKLQEAQHEKQQNLPAINLKDYPIGFVEVLFWNFKGQVALQNPLPTSLPCKPRSFVETIFRPPAC